MSPHPLLQVLFFAAFQLIGPVSSFADEPKNLVTNGTFTRDFIGWSLHSGDQAGWNGFDIGGDPNSGSAYVANTLAASGMAEIGLSQCVILPAAPGYFFRVSSWAAVAQSPGALYVTLLIHLGTNCNGGIIYLNSIGMLPVADWRTKTVAITGFSSPVTAEIWLRSEKDVENGSFSGYFDNILLSDDAVFINRFEP